MMKIGSVLLLLALALAIGIPAQAGGNGAATGGLYVGYYPATGGNSRIAQPPERVGNAVFRPAGEGKVDVQLTLRKGKPNLELDRVFLVPLASWGFQNPSDWYSVTTDKHGHATLRFQVEYAPNPNDTGDTAAIKAILRTGTGREPGDTVYVTELLQLSKKKLE